MTESRPQLMPPDESNATLLGHLSPADWRNPDPAPCYNLVVVGVGAAGYAAVREGLALGARVAAVERWFMGGTHVVAGGIATQCLARSSRSAGEMVAAPRYGVSLTNRVEPDFATAMERMRYLRTQVAEQYRVADLAKAGADVFFGEARFTGTDTLEVDGCPLRFRRAVVATGSGAVLPAVEGLREANPLTSDEVFSLTRQPRRLVIVGGGFIACELAQIFRRFGSEVTLLVRSGILSGQDADVTRFVREVLDREGIRFLEGRLRRVQGRDAEKVLSVEVGNGLRRLEADALLVAAGRGPNVLGLGLEAARVEYDRKSGIRVNDLLKTANPAVYAAGDVALAHRFAHLAAHSGALAARNALVPLARERYDAGVASWCLHTDPEVACIGLTEAQATAQGIGIETFTVPFSATARAVVDGDEHGFVRIHVRNGSDRLVGAAVAGPGAGELVGYFAQAMAGRRGLCRLAAAAPPATAYAEAIRLVADRCHRTHGGRASGEFTEAWLRLQRNP